MSPYDYGTITISTPGVWLINYMLYGGSSSNPQGTVVVFSSASGLLTNIGTSTAPFAETTLAPAAGGTNAVIASGSFITIVTGTTIFDVYINMISGSITAIRGLCYVNYTRIG